jgi:DNA-binding MarR family transcriptional regulator
MNTTVELVNQWAAFEEKHSQGNIEDFCRHYLITRREKENTGKLFGKMGLPPKNIITLTKLLNRINKLNTLYIQLAMSETGVEHLDEFLFLTTIANMKTPMKTEVIYYNFSELSTGLLILERLKKKKYITEYDNPDDKRSRQIKITSRGEKILKGCYARFGKVHEMMYRDLSEDDIKLCIQLLQNVEIKFSALWQKHKGRMFEDVYGSMMGKNHKTKKAYGLYNID